MARCLRMGVGVRRVKIGLSLLIVALGVLIACQGNRSDGVPMVLAGAFVAFLEWLDDAPESPRGGGGRRRG